MHSVKCVLLHVSHDTTLFADTTSPFANTTCDCTKTVVTTTAPQTGTITAAMLLQTTEAELDVKFSAAEDDSCDATVFTDILHCISDK
jgi:hypothetical protein